MNDQKGKGRPEFVPTDEQREKAKVCRAQGMSYEAIAEALGIAINTLKKHFMIDLECATAQVTAEIMMARYNSAKGGNVSAQNKLLELAGAMPPKPPQEKKEPKRGKKEQADIDAQQAHEDTSWGEIIN